MPEMWLAHLEHDFTKKTWTICHCEPVPQHLVSRRMPLVFTSVEGYWIIADRDICAGQPIDPADELIRAKNLLDTIPLTPVRQVTISHEHAGDLAQQIVAKAMRRE